MTGEKLLLDLLNSRPVVDGVEQDELTDRQSGLAWLRAHGAAPTPAELRSARKSRDVVRDVVLGRRPLTAMAGLLGGVRPTPVASAQGIGWQVDDPHADRIAVRAALAWGEVQREHPDRLRACGNPDCQLFLLDRSRAGTARWCSMATCGNRMKARRHHARSREN